MAHPLEAVYKDGSLKATEKAVLAYLVFRANGEGVCWPGATTIQSECGISRNTRIRTIGNLVDMGRIRIADGGQGRGNTQVIEISSRYTKGTSFDTFSKQEKVPVLTPFNEEKVPNLTQKVPNLNVEPTRTNNKNIISDPIPFLISRFEELTLLAPPHSSTVTYQDKWAGPITRWLGFCGGDPARVGQLMTDAVGELRNNGNGKHYRLSSPASLSTTISNLIASRSVQLDAGPDYGADFDTYFSIAASRHKSLRTAGAPEYVVQVVERIGRGKFQQCDDRGRSFLRAEFINAAKTHQVTP